MASGLKLLTLWLLAIALPVQGWAAATMAQCEMSHRHPHSARGHDATAPVHRVAAALPNAAVKLSAVAAPLHHHGPSATLPQGKSAGQGDHGCSACGACCSPAVMPTTARIVADPAPVAGWDSLAVQGCVDFVTSGPDRPPRRILA
jgi:hypothetical protein